MRKNILILLLVIVVVMILMILGSGGSVNGESGGGSVVGKVSNTFGSSLGRDIDGDGDNDSGVILSNIAGDGNDYGNSIAIDGSGRIYVTGSSRNVNGNDDAYVIRLNKDGSIDSSFGSGGKVILKDIAGVGDDYGNSIAIDGSGKIYVTGQSGKVYNYNAYVIRLNVDGSIDSGFGIRGKIILSNIVGGGNDYGNSIAIDGSGRIYVTGSSRNVNGNDDAYVIRLNVDGSMDSSFGIRGKVILKDIAGNGYWDYGYSLSIDGNEKVYVTGQSGNDAYVIRLNKDGSMDSGFGSNLGRDINGDGNTNDYGVILNNIAGGGCDWRDYGYSIVIDRSGKVYFTGWSRNISNYDAYVIRLNVDGSMDSSFGIGGKVILNYIAGGGNDYGNSIVIDGSGKIYVTGDSYNGANWDAYVIRLNEDGSMDSSFGSNLGRDINGDGNTNDYGVILNNIAGGGNDIGKSIAIDGSGKVYVTGDSYNGSNSDAYVIRLNEDGSMDGSFGSGGKVILSSIAGGNGVDYGSSVAIDGNGKVYVTGFSSNGSNDDAFVIRLNSDGSVDSGFGSGGKVVLHNITGGNGRDICNSMVIDVNGKVYITGYSDNISSNADAYVIKIE